jgi:hypothetical protein
MRITGSRVLIGGASWVVVVWCAAPSGAAEPLRRLGGGDDGGHLEVDEVGPGGDPLVQQRAVIAGHDLPALRAVLGELLRRRARELHPAPSTPPVARGTFERPTNPSPGVPVPFVRMGRD